MNAKYSVNIQIRIKKYVFSLGLFEKTLLNLQEYIFTSTRDCLLGKAGKILSRRVLFVLPTQRSLSRKKIGGDGYDKQNSRNFWFKMCFQSLVRLNFNTFPPPP